MTERINKEVSEKITGILMQLPAFKDAMTDRNIEIGFGSKSTTCRDLYKVKCLTLISDIRMLTALEINNSVYATFNISGHSADPAEFGVFIRRLTKISDGANPLTRLPMEYGVFVLLALNCIKEIKETSVAAGIHNDCFDGNLFELNRVGNEGTMCPEVVFLVIYTLYTTGYLNGQSPYKILTLRLGCADILERMLNIDE